MQSDNEVPQSLLYAQKKHVDDPVKSGRHGNN